MVLPGTFPLESVSTYYDMLISQASFVLQTVKLIRVCMSGLYGLHNNKSDNHI